MVILMARLYRGSVIAKSADDGVQESRRVVRCGEFNPDLVAVAIVLDEFRVSIPRSHA
jgi:hypothetical protein